MADRTETDPTAGAPTRRTVLRGAVLAGAAVPFLAACGSGSDSDAGSGGATKTSEPNTSGSPETSNGGGGGAGGSNGNNGEGVDVGPTLASTNDVPAGGGLILDTEEVVITQPAAGEFKCFTAICTHMNCTVANVSGGTINCTCHGSMFSIEDGSVVAGPAPSPLAPKEITVQGKDISLA